MEIFATADAITGYCDVHCSADDSPSRSLMTMVGTLPGHRTSATWNTVGTASQELLVILRWHFRIKFSEPRCFWHPGATAEGHLGLTAGWGRNGCVCVCVRGCPLPCHWLLRSLARVWIVWGQPHYPAFIYIFLSIRHYVTSQTTLWEACFMVSGRHFLSLPQIPSCCLSRLPSTYLGRVVAG